MLEKFKSQLHLVSDCLVIGGNFLRRPEKKAHVKWCNVEAEQKIAK